MDGNVKKMFFIFSKQTNKQGTYTELQMIRHFRMCKVVDDSTILAINIY